MTCMATEQKNQRLYHRKTLEDLPMAVCSLGRDGEILMWNRAMQLLTQIPSEDITGSRLQDLDEPWRGLLLDFSQNSEPHYYRRPKIGRASRRETRTSTAAAAAREQTSREHLADG